VTGGYLSVWLIVLAIISSLLLAMRPHRVLRPRPHMVSDNSLENISGNSKSVSANFSSLLPLQAANPGGHKSASTEADMLDVKPIDAPAARAQDSD